MSEKIKEAVKEAVRQALLKNGEKSYVESQVAVPVDTGALKGSGSFASMADGCIISYKMEYASIVERGWEGGLVWTNPHIRSGSTYVKGHYKNQPFREGRQFIENSIRKFFKSEEGTGSPFQQDFIESLSELIKPLNVRKED